MVKAIIWDYDGTLVDTRRKNLAVTREIMQQVIDDPIDKYEVLHSLNRYQEANENSANWKELYRNYFHLSDSQIDKAGAMWTEYQINNDTEVPLFNGIRTVLRKLQRYSHGIVSQNAHKNIVSYLSSQQLDSIFTKVIGYEEISYDQQKPDPTGLLSCIEHLTDLTAGSVLYVGDHETDTQCAYLANEKLKDAGSNLQIFSIGALYGTSSNVQNWTYKPDFKAHNPKDIASIVENLAS